MCCCLRRPWTCPIFKTDRFSSRDITCAAPAFVPRLFGLTEVRSLLTHVMSISALCNIASAVDICWCGERNPTNVGQPVTDLLTGTGKWKASQLLFNFLSHMMGCSFCSKPTRSPPTLQGGIVLHSIQGVSTTLCEFLSCQYIDR